MNKPDGRIFRRALWLGVLACFMLMKPAGQSHAFDAAAAEVSFGQCRLCHEIGAGAKSKLGPHLNALAGRPAAALDGFGYSRALRDAARSGLVWNAGTLDAFLKRPRDFLKGTRMNYVGMRDDNSRANLVQWLLHFSVDGPDAAKPDGTAEMIGAAVAINGDPEYGRYLSGECVTCHRITGGGGDENIPAITGLPIRDFIHALYEYKTGIRDNPVMQTVAGRLGDEEMAALAAYFNSLSAQ